jgi:cytosine/adenosine deaminase-related metal-dependent hydrolase
VRLLSAEWVLPVAADPIRGGGVVVDEGGTIVGVGPAAVLRETHPDARSEDLGSGSIVMPGLVDAHCHLEWSCFDGVVGSRPFGEWLREFLPRRRLMRAEDHAAAALHGAVRALRAGVTTVADAGPTGTGVEALTQTGQRGVVHLEAFGAPAGTREAGALAASVAERVAALDERAGERVRVGLSPHAPYSVGPLLWHALSAEATLAERQWMTHIAESQDEESAILDGEGPIADLFRDAGIAMGRWEAAEAAGSVVARMDAHGALREGLVAAHCVRLRWRDAARLRRAGVRVAHCPRSNLHLRCGTAPVPGLFGAGVPVALGTDSPASGGDYDPRAEGRACRALFGDAAPPVAQLVRMITHDAARALGMGDRVGAIEPGMRADLLVLDHPHAAGDADPHALALDPAATVRSVRVDGEVILQGGAPVHADAAEVEGAARAIAARLR